LANKKNRQYVIASGRSWNLDLANRLNAELPAEFTLISDPEDLNLERLDSIKPRYVFFPHWSHIIPREIHETFDCVIFHMTDLPYGRGGSPLQNLILRGHADTVVSALKCVAELDAGPIFLKVPLSLVGTAQEIFERADKVIEGMIRSICETEQIPVPQVGPVTLFRRRLPRESEIPSDLDVKEVFDFIRMLDADGYPHAFMEFDGRRLEFRDAKLEAGVLTSKVTFKTKESRV
jgi:methionyl-tRNA formyltransferase